MHFYDLFFFLKSVGVERLPLAIEWMLEVERKIEKRLISSRRWKRRKKWEEERKKR